MAAADRLIVMERGRIVLDGSPRTVFPEMSQRGISGFSLPPLADLMNRLTQRGWRLPTDVNDVAEACGAIHRCLLEASRSDPRRTD
jgi:energy-coupling factor transporter ATP-binding protein EcfA2